VLVTGTAFELSRRQGVSTLKVARGTVRFGGGGLRIGGMQQIAVQPGSVPAAPRRLDGLTVAGWRNNRAPGLQIGPLRTAANTPARIGMEAWDPDGDHLRFTVVERPGKGELQGTAPEWTYVPREGYSGPDRLRIRVSDGLAESETVTVEITVVRPNRPPVPVLTAEPVRGRAPLKVSFSAEGSHDPDDEPVTCTWSFGDDSVVKGLETEHVYRRAGRYVARLMVADPHGARATRELEVTVLEAGRLRAPTRFQYHYRAETRESYFSWRDNSDNEDGFLIERARGMKGRLRYEVFAELGPGVTLWPARRPKGEDREWSTYRVRAFRRGEAGERVLSPPSNGVPVRYGAAGPRAAKNINWPPPGYRGLQERPGTRGTRDAPGR
jgi:hypothetical protein